MLRSVYFSTAAHHEIPCRDAPASKGHAISDVFEQAALPQDEGLTVAVVRAACEPSVIEAAQLAGFL
jgi:hypothetical protein